MIIFKIEELPPTLRNRVEGFLVRHAGTTAAISRPKIAFTQSICIAFCGSHLDEELSGIGRTPCEALENFNENVDRSIQRLFVRNGHSKAGKPATRTATRHHALALPSRVARA